MSTHTDNTMTDLTGINTVTSKAGKQFAAGRNAETGKVHLAKLTNRNPYWGTLEDREYLVQVCGTRGGHTRNALYPSNEAVSCGNCIARAERLGLKVAR